MGMHAPVPQFLLDANVAGGLVRFLFFFQERAEGSQSSSVGFRVLSPSQTLCSANFLHCSRQVHVGIVDLRPVLILVQSNSAVMKKLLIPAGRSTVPQILLEAQTQITHHRHLFEKKLRKKQ